MPFTLSTRQNMIPILLRSRCRCVRLHKLPLEKGGIWNNKTLRFKTFQPSLLNSIARTVLRNEVKMWPSQLWLRFQQSQIKPKKMFSGLQRDSNPWPLRQRCSAPPTELWGPTRCEEANLLSSSYPWKELNISYCWNRNHNCDDHIFTSFVCPQFT